MINQKDNGLNVKIQDRVDGAKNISTSFKSDNEIYDTVEQQARTQSIRNNNVSTRNDYSRVKGSIALAKSQD